MRDLAVAFDWEEHAIPSGTAFVVADDIAP
jgi:hypothetical protein